MLEPDGILAEKIRRIPARYKNDPLGFVKMAWPWGVAGGPLEELARSKPSAVRTLTRPSFSKIWASMSLSALSMAGPR